MSSTVALEGNKHLNVTLVVASKATIANTKITLFGSVLATSPDPQVNS
jgi:hypothetical protein